MSHTHPHEEKGIVQTCIDGRFNAFFARMLKEHGPAFTIGLAGGALAFLSETDGTAALRQVEIARSVNPAAATLWLFSHMDCGYYKASGRTFADEADEIRQKWQDLRQAQTLIETSVPGITVELGLAGLDGQLVPEPA